jgi:hypothetical protein
MAITQEQYDEAKRKDSRAKKISVDVCGESVEVVARPASRAEWKAYKALANSADENKSATANEQLLSFCALSPHGSELTDLLNKFPAVADVVASKVKEISGLSARVEVDL